MSDHYDLLMIPGPTNLPDEVREALALPQISHRGSRFKELLLGVTEGLQRLFGATQPVLSLTSSGTGAMEAAIINLLAPGDPVVAVDGGKFGQRLGDIAQAFGAEVHRLMVERGQACTETQLAAACEAARPRAVLMVQNETSTGVAQDIPALAEIARRFDALTLVDCVSCLGGYPMKMDEWGLDAVAAGSQKALMLPPGLAFAALSERGWQAAAEAKMPSYYFNLRKAKKSLAEGQTPYTPNTSLFVALERSLHLIFTEGLERVFARHAALAAAAQAGAEALGLTLFAAPGHRSPTVTSILSPEGIDSSALTRAVRDRHSLLLSGGQDELKGKIFRLGHMGLCRLEHVEQSLAAVADVLGDMGFTCDGGAAAAAAREAYAATRKEAT